MLWLNLQRAPAQLSWPWPVHKKTNLLELTAEIITWLISEWVIFPCCTALQRNLGILHQPNPTLTPGSIPIKDTVTNSSSEDYRFTTHLNRQSETATVILYKTVWFGQLQKFYMKWGMYMDSRTQKQNSWKHKNSEAKWTGDKSHPKYGKHHHCFFLYCKLTVFTICFFFSAMTLWIIVSAAWGQMPFQFRQLIKTSDKSWGVNVLQCEVVELSL